LAELPHILSHALMITIFVFVMMMLVDYVNVLTKGRMSVAIKGGRWRQYLGASFLGATPGCLGAFLNVSFYIHGLLTFGAMVGGMIATTGDEAFVMLALFPGKALLLFLLLFIMGIGFAWIADKIASVLHIVPCQGCELQEIHPEDQYRFIDFSAILTNLTHISWYRALLLGIAIAFLIAIITGAMGPSDWGWERATFTSLLFIAVFIVGTVPDHYLKEHIWSHIVKEHLWRVFLWSFFAILFVEVGLKYWNLEAFIKEHLVWVLLLGVLLGIIPESGPHLIFVMMFAQGLIPFSVLLASSFVQDGHGMLPLFSYTIRDSLLIKAFNLVFGLAVGAFMLLLGF
jgi:hypothetical protein